MTRNCSTTNYAYWKDDTNTLEKFAFSINFFYALGLLFLNFYHILTLLTIRKSMKRLTIVNFSLFLTLLSQCCYFVDGLIALFNGYGYLDLEAYYVLYFNGICLLNISLTLSYYNWTPLMVRGYDGNIENP